MFGMVSWFYFSSVFNLDTPDLHLWTKKTPATMAAMSMQGPELNSLAKTMHKSSPQKTSM